MIKIRNNKNGITLIELLIVLAVLSLVIVMSFSFFSFGNRMYTLGIDQQNVQSSIRIASDYITGQIRYASMVEILDYMDADKINDPSNEIDAYENYIYYDGSSGDIIRLSRYDSPKTFNINSGGGIEFNPSTDNKVLFFTVNGIDSNQSYSISSEVKPLNLGLEGSNIVDSSGVNAGVVIRYRTANDYLSKTALPEALITNSSTDFIEINFSKGIISSASNMLISDTVSPSTVTFTLINSFNLRVDIDPVATNGRSIEFELTLDDGGIYKYTLEYVGNWVIENR